MTPAIEVSGLSREFDRSGQRTTALSDIGFSVAEGEIVALLGENGAGKTTLTKVLATLLLPTAGTARVMGHDVTKEPDRVRRVQSVVFGGDKGFYSRLTARDNLRFFAMLNGADPKRLDATVRSALESVGLTEVAGRRLETFSKGMRQRLHLAVGFSTSPRVMLLDEPTVGLDPIEAARLRSDIAAMRERGISILLTSHYLLDVEELADRVVVLDKGRLIEDMPLADFARRAGFAATIIVTGRGEPPTAVSSRTVAAAAGQPEAGRWQLTLSVKEWSAGALQEIGALLDGRAVESFDVTPARLEDSFRQLYAGRQS
ncbi:ABC transporter ATP-binding protein [Streptomyces sp. CB03911]|uniref:ABC transporter ATP-binding protein n=1 Tax=Streptomyces sp. CB03911 TaxID=1804758 RepID=UPI000B10CF2E|nr:ABC transporter ATP-binding protein [Streptomyces sp. CB03911]